MRRFDCHAGHDHAVQLIGQHPALTYGNIFEIRPAADMNDEVMKASEQRRRQVVAPKPAKHQD
jgi:hypothetical protein